MNTAADEQRTREALWLDFQRRQAYAEYREAVEQGKSQGRIMYLLRQWLALEKRPL